MKLKRANNLILLAILFMGMVSHSFAQKRRINSYDDRAWFIGAEGGANIFFGDIKYWDYFPNVEYNELTFGGGLQFGKFLSPKFLLKGNLHYATLSGTKKTTNLLRTFDTKLYEGSLNLNINLFQLFNNRPNLNKISAWGEIGIGYSRWQTLLYNTRTGDTINNLNWDSKQYQTAFMIPIGMNIKYYLNKKFSIDLFSSLRFVNSDLQDAKEGGIVFDYYWINGIAINYHLSQHHKTRSRSTVKAEKSDEIELLDYLSIDPFSDPEFKRITKKEYLEKEEEKAREVLTSSNPYLIEFWVPQQANNTRFQVLVSIKKRGITGNGFFRLRLPSGFYPVPPKIKEVTYTRIAYNYDFDFYLPMNLDTLLIPIDITISEREDGTYPLFIEGEIMNQDGEIFTVKNAQYVHISGGIDYNDLPIIGKNTDSIVPPKKVYNHPENVSEVVVEAAGDQTYRIQILACRKPSKRVDEFLKKHQIDQKIYIYEANKWWRYSIYNLSTIEQADKYLKMIRTTHRLPDAFIVEFTNGIRSVPKNQPSRVYSSIAQANDVLASRTLNERNNLKYTTDIPKENTKKNTNKIYNKKDNQGQQKDHFQPVQDIDKISVYRIEIAVSPSSPIPLRQLQNWVANEKINEWMYKDEYRYTIGRFENEQVARAFLKYVRMQFALPDAHLVETKGNIWVRVVR
ncbi:MAG: hypothetical protein GQ527_11890 [Bacteroidales bacterium]|nr:hypothetical protein [Bacteroidales bacterium]